VCGFIHVLAHIAFCLVKLKGKESLQVMRLVYFLRDYYPCKIDRKGFAQARDFFANFSGGLTVLLI